MHKTVRDRTLLTWRAIQQTLLECRTALRITYFDRQSVDVQGFVMLGRSADPSFSARVPTVPYAVTVALWVYCLRSRRDRQLVHVYVYV